MGRFARSWELGKTSWRVLRKDKELMWLPVLGGVACVIIAGIVTGLSFLGARGLWVFLGAIACAVAVYFFQGALMHGARERLQGGDPTVRSAIQGASRRLGVIALWAVVALVVGLIMNALEQAARQRMGVLGGLLVGLAEFGWRVMTFLVMPVVMFEGLGPFAAIGRSRSLLRRTWGENLMAQVGLSVVGLVLALPGILVLALLAGPLGAFGVVVGGLLIVVAMVVASSLSAVYQTALYEYATTGQELAEFKDVGLRESFKVREGAGRWGQPGQYRT